MQVLASSEGPAIDEFHMLKPQGTSAPGKQMSEDQLKSYTEAVRMLAVCAVNNGNLALNTNPMPDGRIEPRQVEAFKKIGEWLTKYGESIYGTRGGPFIAPDWKKRSFNTDREHFSVPDGNWWGGSTHNGNVIYLHVLRWPSDTIRLPAIKQKIVKHSVLTGGEATVSQTDTGIEFTVPAVKRDAVDTIVKLELDAPTEMPPATAPAAALPETRRAQIPERGVGSTVPASRWDYGFLTGNGRMGTIIYGQTTNETVIFNHARLYLPHPRPLQVDLGQYWPEVRRIMREKGHKAGLDFSLQKAKELGHFNYHSDPFHLAFELKIETPVKGAATNYLRTTDFETGEVAVRWQDDEGGCLRRLFVSRPDNVVVLSITRPAGGKLNLSLAPVPVAHKYIGSELKIEKDWIAYHNAYTNSPGGYDNVVRVVARGGRTESDGKKIVVTGADELLLLARVVWHENRRDDSVEAVKSSLAADYAALLKPHAAEHGRIFNRVTLDLGGGADRWLTSEELLARAKSAEYKRVPAALLEKLYDASRFYFICSAGLMPPNLQGIWNGVFTAPWSGSFTYDTNVQNAMDSALSGNMTEGMEGYFRLIETSLPEWRINARKLYGARGLVAPIVGSANCSLLVGDTGCWAWQYWTAGGGWLASYFYDYYRFTGDKKFLVERAVPLMKEIALFYEDFLAEKDEKGHCIYRPSYSPEVGALLVSDNSTFDVAIAKELLTNLIAACEELRIEPENVVKWRALLKTMPPYQIGPDGDLAEWADGSFRHAYNHRHYSPFYPLWRSFEFTPDGTPELWNAAKVALKKKGNQWLRNPKGDWAGIPFGRSFHAQAAAYLGQGALVEEILNSMTDRVYPSLHMSLKPNGDIFNFDGSGAYPDIINRSLAFGLNGTLDLLRSIPPGWERGRIGGILARGQITINSLQWDQAKGSVELELTSAVDQTLTLRLPGSKSITGLTVIEGGTVVGVSPRGPTARTVTLPAERKVKLSIQYSDGETNGTGL
jgi:hypothetical protein